MEAIIIIGLFILIVCGIILLFIGSFVMGVILQQFVYFVCFILQIFGYSSFADWAESNNIVLLIICCIISALCVFIPIISGLASRDSSKIRQGIDYDEYTNYSNDNNTNYFWGSYSEDKRKRITFVDASGHTENGEIALLTVKETGVDGETHFMIMMEIILVGEIPTKI